MYDAYSAFDRRERDNERTIDLNRENAAEHYGITPANVPVWMRLRVERMDGSTDLNATCNALCAHIRALDEAAADEIREHMAEVQILADIREVTEADNHKLRNRVTVLNLLLHSMRDRWDERSTGMTLLQLDLLLDNPDAVQVRRAA
jgi:hypothetical protein